VAQRTITILTDDLDGTEGNDVETVSFSFAGAQYEIDLTPENRDGLEKALEPYLKAARKAGKPVGATRRRPAAKGTEDLDAIRQWARENGHQVSDRGRVAQKVKDAYYAERG
jgi:hypothetical protein